MISGHIKSPHHVKTPDGTDAKQWLPIFYAIYSDAKKDVVKKLYELYPKSIEYKDSYKFLPLHIAAEKNRGMHIPFLVQKNRLLEDVSKMVRDKKIEGIRDIRDESDQKGMRVVFELKRDASPVIVENQLYKHSVLETSFAINNVALVKGQPRPKAIPPGGKH